MSPPDRTDEPEIELPAPRPTLLQRLALWVHTRALKDWVRARGRSAALDAMFDQRIPHRRRHARGALAYRLFLFALPLALFVAPASGCWQARSGTKLITNSVGLAGVVAGREHHQAHSNWWVALGSFFLLVYVARVLLRAIAIAHSLAWERSAASVKVHRRSLAIFGAALAGQLFVVAGVGAVNHQTVIGGIVTFGLLIFGLAGLWLIVPSLQLPHSDARWADLIPGSLLYAAGFICLLLFNVLILGHLIQEKTSTYGALGTAATLLLGFFLYGRVIVGAAVLNATSRTPLPLHPADAATHAAGYVGVGLGLAWAPGCTVGMPRVNSRARSAKSARMTRRCAVLRLFSFSSTMALVVRGGTCASSSAALRSASDMNGTAPPARFVCALAATRSGTAGLFAEMPVRNDAVAPSSARRPPTRCRSRRRAACRCSGCRPPRRSLVGRADTVTAPSWRRSSLSGTASASGSDRRAGAVVKASRSRARRTWR